MILYTEKGQDKLKYIEFDGSVFKSEEVIVSKENIVDFLVFNSEFFILEQLDNIISIQKINRKN